ncbi:phytoene/squalene synthase family protein [Roseospirillum parvum]|uniref:Phytoene synthase n=1 Tax=Roseospirillum parvum TaxID=83401 RepID=A0A1G7V232_9PROT|nr:squalene/phytoene synthase family protein [Roseospirillum parvum]SDG53429.1 phytoene synthase [Roseospirillum parvum]
MSRPPKSAASALPEWSADLKAGDPDRFVLGVLTPPPGRAAVLALYAWNLEVARCPERTNEPMLGLMRLAWWRDTLERLCAGQPAASGSPLARALAEAVARHDLPFAPFADILAARQREVDGLDLPDLAAVEAHVASLNGSLGELAATVLGIEDGPSRRAVRAAFLAQGLCGVVRALPGHVAEGRPVLPADRLRALETTPTRLVSDSGRGARKVILGDILGLAEDHLAVARRPGGGSGGGTDGGSGGGSAGKMAPSARPLLLVNVQTRGYLKALRRSGFDLHDRRVVGPNPRPLGLALAQLLPGVFG